MAKKPGSNKDNLAQTRARFLKKARKEFVEYGFVNASTNRIVEESGMARGSLYYHFKDKRRLFVAVYEQTMEEMLDIIQTVKSDYADPWEAFIAACRSYLLMCKEQTVRAIIMDAHAALTYQERFDIQNRTLTGALSNTLAALQKDGYFKGMSIPSLQMALFGMLSEAGRSLDIAENIDKTCEDMSNTIVDILERLRG